MRLPVCCVPARPVAYLLGPSVDACLPHADTACGMSAWFKCGRLFAACRHGLWHICLVQVWMPVCHMPTRLVACLLGLSVGACSPHADMACGMSAWSKCGCLFATCRHGLWHVCLVKCGRLLPLAIAPCSSQGRCRSYLGRCSRPWGRGQRVGRWSCSAPRRRKPAAAAARVRACVSVCVHARACICAHVLLCAGDPAYQKRPAALCLKPTACTCVLLLVNGIVHVRTKCHTAA